MDALEQIAAAVLYEGYILWPYRRSARKNAQRWTFGGVYPPAFAHSGDRSSVQTECIVLGAAPSVDVELRFLQVVQRRVARVGVDGALEFVDSLTVGTERILAWDEAIERRISLSGPFVVPAGEEREVVDSGVGAVVRSWSALHGCIDVSLTRVDDGVSRVTAVLSNTSDWSGSDRDAAQRHGFMSAHFVLHVRDGAFVSAVEAAQPCSNVGLWPVLVENEQTMLASPIILYDYPRIAPESFGLLFDSGEIDQLLILNTLVLTDAEKAEVRATDPRAREILDRAESLCAEDLGRLHGAIRELRPIFPMESEPPNCVTVNGVTLRAGSPVRLHPRARADVFDLALNNRLAIIESIEQDFEDHIHLAVTLPDDPGNDLGLQHLPGHRFFFSPDEVEPVRP